MAYLPIIFGLALSAILSTLFTGSSNTPSSPPSSLIMEDRILKYRAEAVQWYLLAALLELCVEPMSLVAQNMLLYRARVLIESIAIFTRCLLTFILSYLAVFGYVSGGGYVVDPFAGDGDDGRLRNGVMAFAYAQIGYSVVLAMGYIHLFHVLFSGREPSKVFWRKMYQVPEGKDGKCELVSKRWLDMVPRPVTTADGQRRYVNKNISHD
jgi:hypothetical protein